MLDSLIHMLSGETELDRQIAALEALGDRELADLGISRDRIEAYVRALAGASG